MNYREQITEAWTVAMRDDPKVLILGEGVTDPKGIFGTTLGGYQSFPDRVIETPLSENMITGACLGMALEGWKPMLVHARCEFIMLSMEHLVDTIAKWGAIHRREIGLVVRALVGRGWGQGPNHSQAFHAMFAHVPGLRVLYPVIPENMQYWVKESLTWGGPTVIMEPRRLYEVESLDYPTWDEPEIYIVTFGDIVLDAAAAAVELKKSGVKAQVWPIEDVSAMQVPQTQAPVVVADTGQSFCGASAEVVARMSEQGNVRTRRVGPPFIPLPTSYALEQIWYPSVNDIYEAVTGLLGSSTSAPKVTIATDAAFTGPF
jgi:pyruvate/2-oxoglutarate/acetoin dehydrogenase E1 component